MYQGASLHEGTARGGLGYMTGPRGADSVPGVSCRMLMLIDDIQNTIDDIKNTQTIWRVIKGGWVFDSEKLRPSRN